MVPLGRRGTPEEVANIFAFLASEQAVHRRDRNSDVQLAGTSQFHANGDRREPVCTVSLRRRFMLPEARLVTAALETVNAVGRPIKVTWLMLTDIWPQALAGA